MKKRYNAPEYKEIELLTTDIITTSIRIDNDKEVDAGDSFAGKQRGEWGNIWE